MKLYIKNMVCPRCIMAVKEIFLKLNIEIESILLGEVVIRETISTQQKKQLADFLYEYGFELLSDNNQQLIEQIKSIVINKIHYSDSASFNATQLLPASLHRDYSSLSKLFSSVEGISIEQYIILQRVERVKELLTYNQKTLSQIAFDLGYSSVAYLSAQFKKVTGLTPSEFKKERQGRRKSIDHLLSDESFSDE